MTVAAAAEIAIGKPIPGAWMASVRPRHAASEPISRPLIITANQSEKNTDSRRVDAAEPRKKPVAHMPIVNGTTIATSITSVLTGLPDPLVPGVGLVEHQRMLHRFSPTPNSVRLGDAEAEGVPSRITEDPEGLAWLVFGLVGAEFQGRGRGCVEVVHHEVEV